MDNKEKEMIEKLNVRDKRAFEYVFTEFYHSLCYFANKYVGDEEVAQDIVQEIFVWFYESKNRFENLMAVKSFLYSCVYNKVINYLKADRNQSIIREKIKNLSNEEDSCYEDYQIETEVFEEIFKAIEELPEECRRIFKMSYIEKKCIKEIMDTLNIAESTIKTQRQRAKKILRDRLKHLYSLAIIIFSLN